jgi:hypothetical protein
MGDPDDVGAQYSYCDRGMATTFDEGIHNTGERVLQIAL